MIRAGWSNGFQPGRLSWKNSEKSENRIQRHSHNSLSKPSKSSLMKQRVNRNDFLKSLFKVALRLDMGYIRIVC